jgi:nucleotide-binding universal stress UspA family protein
MLNKILVATDGSTASACVLDQALMLAKATGAHLGLLHVTDPDEVADPDLPAYLTNRNPYLDEGDSEPCCYVGQFATEDPALFGQSVAKVTAAGLSCDCIHCFGDPETAISDFATAWQADLIVLGRRERSRIAEFFLGSVSNYTLHHAPCSVHVVYCPTAEDPQPAVAQPQAVSL